MSYNIYAINNVQIDVLLQVWSSAFIQYSTVYKLKKNKQHSKHQNKQKKTIMMSRRVIFHFVV